MITEIDIAVPVRTAYNQWTQFEDFPLFMDHVAQGACQMVCVSAPHPCEVVT